MGTILLRRIFHSDDNGVDETEFSTVDGRELDGTRKWARVHAPLFGKQQPAEASAPNGESSNAGVNAKPTADGEDALDSDTDPEDEDFAMDSNFDSDGVSTDSSECDGDAKAGGSAEEDAGDGDGDSERSRSDEDSNGDSEPEHDFDPARHLLLRPGAMPKISRATIETVVGMVKRDLVGSGTHLVDDEDEEDELDEWSS